MYRWVYEVPGFKGASVTIINAGNKYSLTLCFYFVFRDHVTDDLINHNCTVEAQTRHPFLKSVVQVHSLWDIFNFLSLCALGMGPLQVYRYTTGSLKFSLILFL